MISVRIAIRISIRVNVSFTRMIRMRQYMLTTAFDQWKVGYELRKTRWKQKSVHALMYEGAHG